MEIIVVALTIAVILRDPPGTIRAATAYKQAQIRKAQLKGGRAARRPGRRAFRNYLGTVWEAKWEEAARRYPDKMRKAQARREKRRAKRAEKWEQAKAAAGRRWEARRGGADDVRLFDRDPAGAAPEPSGPAPEGVVDLEEARRRRE